jgi:hypothetical protein
MKYILLLSTLFAACHLSSPQAPSWELTGTVPLVAKTVFVREIAESEDEFFFGDYGPWRFMDTDSVLTSVLSDSGQVDLDILLALPSDRPDTFNLGPYSWGDNPLDEIEEPYFYRAWLEIVVRHNLPGDIDAEIDAEGWDDDLRSCGTIHMDLDLPPSPDGQTTVETIAYAPQEDVLAFVNPSPLHAVPDSFRAVGVAAYTPTGQDIGPDPFVQVEVSLLTALDLSFETTVVAKRAVVKQLIIAPEDDDTDEADVSADVTNKLVEATFKAQVTNNLPVGGHGFFKMAHDSLLLDSDPEIAIGPFDLDAAPFDPSTGKPTGVSTSTSEAYLDSTDITILHNPGPGFDTLYASMEYVLEGTGEQRVCVSAPDSVRLETVAIVSALIEPEDN